MGLDTVELVMDIEDRFAISIPDADAEQIVTVGQLHHYVCRALKLGAARACLTRPMYYRLRKTLMELVAVDRAAVRPRAHIEQLLPPIERKRTWKALGERLGVPLPPLTLAPVGEKWVDDLTLMAGLVAFLGWWLFFIFPPVTALVIWIGAATTTALIARLAVVLSRPYASTVPVSCATVADLCRTAVLADKSTFRNEVGDAWTRDLVYHELRNMIVEALGVKPEQVTPEAEFIRDLGAG